jgi:hypothetical protein
MAEQGAFGPAPEEEPLLPPERARDDEGSTRGRLSRIQWLPAYMRNQPDAAPSDRGVDELHHHTALRLDKVANKKRCDGWLVVPFTLVSPPACAWGASSTLV